MPQEYSEPPEVEEIQELLCEPFVDEGDFDVRGTGEAGGE